MARVSSLISWATAETALRDFLGVPTPAEATSLQLWFESAVEACDVYIENQPGWVALPAKVKLGIFEWVKMLRSGGGVGGTLKRVKTHEFEEEYGDPALVDRARSIERDYWYDRKASPWLV